MSSRDKKIVLLIILLMAAGVLINQVLFSPKTTQMTVPKPQITAEQTNFAANQNPTFSLTLNQTSQQIQQNAKVYDANGNQVNLPVKVSGEGPEKKISLDDASAFTPGKFTLVVYDEKGQKIEQDFLWGVLAINTNKSIYLPEETANIALAVLDEKGNMVCDASVSLTITNPQGQVSTLTTDNNSITVNPECKVKDFTQKPDYQTSYNVGTQGQYKMTLKATTKNGTYSISDIFEVKNSVPFDVERDAATRIFPNDPYPVNLTIKANQDFTGQIREQTPISFVINPLTNTTKYTSVQKQGNFQYVSWDVSLKKDEIIKIGYYFKAPPISPQFYLLGPLSFMQGNASLFQEARSWHLAIDSSAYSTMILGTSGLIAYWRVGETGGSTAYDSKDSADGTYEGTQTLGVTGLINGDSDKALGLVGQDGYFWVSIDNLNPYASGHDFSIEFWARPHDITTNYESTVVENETYNTSGFRLGLNAYDQWRFATSESGGDVEVMDPSHVSQDVLYHVVVTRSGTSFILYVNGTSVDSGSGTLVDPADDTMVGAGAGWHFDGVLDEIAIYNTVLTPTQVQNHYNTGLAQNQTGTSNTQFNGVQMQGIQVK